MNKQKIKAVMFDHGGLLQKFDNYKFLRNISSGQIDVNYLYNTIFSSGLYKLIDVGAITPDDFFYIVKKKCNLKITKLDFFNAFIDRFTDEIKENVELVERLNGKYKLGLLSNTNSLDYENVIKKMDIFELFDVKAISFKIGMRKPDEDFFYYAIDKIGLPPEKLFFVDDNKKYVDTASRIGFKVAVQYTSGLDIEKILKESLK